MEANGGVMEIRGGNLKYFWRCFDWHFGLRERTTDSDAKVIILTKYNSSLGNDKKALQKLTNIHTPTCVLLPYKERSTPSLSPFLHPLLLHSPPSHMQHSRCLAVPHHFRHAVNSTRGSYADTALVILVFPRPFHYNGPPDLFYTVWYECFQGFCWYKVSLPKSELGREVGNGGEISNKVERAIRKGEMLLNLIRIWWSVDLGCSSVEPHRYREMAEWKGSGLNAHIWLNRH